MHRIATLTLLMFTLLSAPLASADEDQPPPTSPMTNISTDAHNSPALAILPTTHWWHWLLATFLEE